MKIAAGPKLRLWLLALYTVPDVASLREADFVARWLIMGRAAVLVMTAVSAVLGGLFAQLSGGLRTRPFPGGRLRPAPGPLCQQPGQ